MSVGSGADTDSSEGSGDPGPETSTMDPGPGPGTGGADSGSTRGAGEDDGTTGGTATLDDGTQDGSDSTGSMQGSVCDPQPQGVSASAQLVEGFVEFEDFELDLMCEVVGMSPVMHGQRIELSCDQEPIPAFFALEVTSAAEALTLPISREQSVRLRALHYNTIDAGLERYIALSQPGGELLLGYVWRWGVDDHHDVAAGWYAPLAMELVEGVCDLEVPVPPMDGGNFIVQECGYQTERLAFDFMLEDEPPQRVYDNQRQMVGDYDVWVTGARRSFRFGPEPDCAGSDDPTPTVQVLMVAIP